jgi:aminomethyltransferase
MKKTILHDAHVALGAKMAPFGGFLMPIQYEGIIAEHTATRTAATVFDTCHMGQFRISGPRACEDLERLVSAPVSAMEVGQCRYGYLCNEQGGVLDDEITYRLAPAEFMMVVNAGTQDADRAWITSHLSPGTAVETLSPDTAKIDLQGPTSAGIMRQIAELPLDGMKYYRFAQNRIAGERVLVSRTGYTGEVGFEIYPPQAMARSVWDRCLSLGAKPAGLGARDTLRLEMGFPLYGHELSAERSAAEAGFERAIAPDKDFIGAAAVRDPARAPQRLVGLVLDGRRAARAHDTVADSTGKRAGEVTSGSFSPSLGVSIAMAYVDKGCAAPGTTLAVRTERAELPAVVVHTPFYARATGRRPLREFL